MSERKRKSRNSAESDAADSRDAASRYFDSEPTPWYERANPSEGVSTWEALYHFVDPTAAKRLYEKAGMHVSREIVMYEKELRPGEELRKQALE